MQPLIEAFAAYFRPETYPLLRNLAAARLLTFQAFSHGHCACPAAAVLGSETARALVEMEEFRFDDEPGRIPGTLSRFVRLFDLECCNRAGVEWHRVGSLPVEQREAIASAVMLEILDQVGAHA